MASPKQLKRELQAAINRIAELEDTINRQNFMIAQYDDELTQCKQQLIGSTVTQEEVDGCILQEQEQ